MKTFSKMTLKEIGKSVLGTTLIVVVVAGGIIGTTYGILSMSKENYSYTIFKSKAELSYYSSKDNLVKCIDNYIDSIAPESAMNGLALVDQCDKYNVDVRFVIAQAQIEGSFATKGVSAKTRSAFNVHAFDGKSASEIISAGHCFKHPDESIEPYLQLLTTTYLVGGKTEMDMLVKYVNKQGQRYASAPNYEQELRKAYQQLISTTNITALQAEYQKYKMVCEK